MVNRYSLQEAQDHLDRLIAEARHGATVLILDDHDQAVQLIPLTASHKGRKAGSARGQIQMAEDFDTGLSDFNDYTV